MSVALLVGADDQFNATASTEDLYVPVFFQVFDAYNTGGDVVMGSAMTIGDAIGEGRTMPEGARGETKVKGNLRRLNHSRVFLFLPVVS